MCVFPFPYYMRFSLATHTHTHVIAGCWRFFKRENRFSSPSCALAIQLKTFLYFILYTYAQQLLSLSAPDINIAREASNLRHPRVHALALIFVRATIIFGYNTTYSRRLQVDFGMRWTFVCFVRCVRERIIHTNTRDKSMALVCKVN